ncbi:S-layer homology domain-containing protein [Lysinibacillus sp. UGB7]|uniref:S-layer homology domain-containing protein n=1 Tax=Lysinibacillus sp. UGB7 TaxID=3411039 RepID=UPI003B812B0D
MKRNFIRHSLNKTLVAALAVGVVTPALVIPATTVNVDAASTYSTPFKDIPSTHVYYDILHQMRDKGIITGYDDNTFKPNMKISRQHAAVLIQRVKTLTPKVSLKQYTDIAKSHPYYEAIMQLQQTGIIKADSKGNFNASKDLTRGEMALVLANAFGLTAKGQHTFKDVSKTSDEGKAIAALFEAGVTTGYDDGTFKPNESLSRAHYAVFLYRALNYEKSTENPVEVPEKEIPKLSMDMSYEDFNKVVANDKKLYDINDESSAPREIAFNNARFKKLLIEGADYVKQTDFQYKSVNSEIILEEPDFVRVLPPGFLPTQILISLNTKTNNVSFAIDFTSEKTVALTRQLFKLAFPELSSLDTMIDEKAKEAREAYALEKDVLYSQREFRGNASSEKVGDYNVRIGTNQRMEFFWIDVEKQQ